ncbi:MAG: hypothetical protein F6K21_03085 [Symploca sp. SIO2D2]|nr:hypothetical protein [Symploca sp. SIO2D2]
MPRDAKGRFITKNQADAEKADAQTSTVQTPVTGQQGNQLAVGRDSQLGGSAYALADVSTTLPDVTPDALLKDPGLNKLTLKDASARLASLEGVKANLEVVLAEQKVTEMGIQRATNQVRIARRVEEFNLETLKLADTKDQVAFQTESNEINSQIRKARITVDKGRLKKWRNKASKAEGYLGVVDAEYTEVS